MLKLIPGTYRLTRNVENPKADRRVKEDWTHHAVWMAGDEFIVEQARWPRHDGDDLEFLRIVKVGHRWRHENVSESQAEQFAALCSALEPCPVSNAAFFTMHEVKGDFVQWLVESGRVSRELIVKLCAEYNEDGQLRKSDPYPQRAPLVEAEPAAPPTSDVAIRELFARIRQGIEDAQSAARSLAVEVGTAMLAEEVDHTTLDRVALINRIYEAIKHGDDEHRAWLRAELNKFKQAPDEPAMKPTIRYVGEVVELTRDCELGRAGERAVVTALEAPHYMTLVFVDREPVRRLCETGADYKFLRPCAATATRSA